MCRRSPAVSSVEAAVADSVGKGMEGGASGGDGLSRATIGVLTASVIADLTATGRFNLAQGLVGALSGIGASVSTSMSGIIVERFGQLAGLLSATAVGVTAVAIVLAFMPDTKPSIPSQAPATWLENIVGRVALGLEVKRRFTRFSSAAEYDRLASAWAGSIGTEVSPRELASLLDAISRNSQQ
jgi:MFS family permease